MGAPSDDDLEDDAVLLSAAGADDSEPVASDVPCCPACGRPTDDVSQMSDMQVLEALRSEFYRDLLRSMRMGMATHQEKAIARGILRDNKVVAEEPEEGRKPRKGSRRRPEPETFDFSPKTLDETAGG